MMVDLLKLMVECVSIRHGEHPGWRGDSVANAEDFMWRFGYSTPDEALVFADELVKNSCDYSIVLGVPECRFRIYANCLRSGSDAALSRMIRGAV